MKYAFLSILLSLVIFYTSCGHRQPIAPEAYLKPDTALIVSPYGPTRMVRHIKQARNGDILIASYTGVLRYDGTSFTNLTTRIPSPSFWDVLEDRHGNLWFGSKDSGVYVQPAGQSGFQHLSARHGLVSNMALNLFEDRAGNIWFSAGGATRYDGKSFRNFTPKDGLPRGGVNAFIEDRTGKLWIGTREELCYFDGKTFTIVKNKDGKPFSNVWGITEDKKGNLWFGATIIEEKRGSTYIVTGGVWRYDGTSFTKVNKRGAGAMITDRNGNLWTAGEVKPPNDRVWALTRYDADSLYNESPAMTEIKSIPGPGFLSALMEANDGSIWFSATGPTTGVYRFDGKTITDFRRKEDSK